MSLANFIKQKHYEKIKLRVRRHPITLLPTIAFFVLLIALPVILYITLGTLFDKWMENEGTFVLLVFLGSSYLIGIILFFYSNFIDFYLDFLVVTNDRLIDVEQIGLFARSISELDLYKIQDITSEVKGILSTIFNYGDIYIQTAGSEPRFIINDISDPHKLRQEILQLAEEDRKFHNITHIEKS